MNFYLYTLVILVSFSAFPAAPIDERLVGYIQKFNLKPLSAPEARKHKLFLLGRDLFRERRISGNDNISCMECHHPRIGTADGIPLSLGEGAIGLEIGSRKRMQGQGRILARNTPALFNLHNVNVMFWDGRVEFNPETKKFITPVPLNGEVARTLTSALAAQAIFPMVDHDEMRGLRGSNPIADAKNEEDAWEFIVDKILKFPEYQKAFAEVFPGQKINIGHFGEALAEFQGQAFFLAETPYDRYLKGNVEALTSKQKIGMEIFFDKAKCGVCHNGEYLSSFEYKAVGSPQIGPGKENGDDYGRHQWDNQEGFRYAFRVPPLRNVGLTAPYFHHGGMATLENVVEHYNDIKTSLSNYRIIEQFSNYLRPLKAHDHTNDHIRIGNIPSEVPLEVGFTEEEKEALVEFLRFGLTDIRLQD